MIPYRFAALALATVLSLGFAATRAGAAAPTAPAELPAADQARIAIDQDPAVVQALRSLEASGHSAAMLEAGPHEWTAGATAQRRRIDGAGNSNEWSVQIERPIRIAGKAGLDRRLGQSTLDLARAQLAAARSEAARNLLDAWIDWLAARQAREVMDDQVRAADENLRTVTLRQKAGDASRLELNVAQGDVAQARQLAVVAATADAKALAALKIRYPSLAAEPKTLPEPAPLAWSEAQWRDRVLEVHPLLTAATQGVRKAELAADRARADRTPDPTVGVFTSSEASRTERVVGISLSIPLGGTYREQASLEALKQVEVARAALERQRRELELAVSGQVQEALGSLERWRLAEQSAAALRETSRLTQKAYAAGEADVQALLLVRRQALEATSSAQAARAEALRAQYRLQIDAGLLWPANAP
ncbi:TolC family protein [Piscinibacter sp.]|uniref:TolC family protein n=1 Tax=Piscinibacter sp. TaxID=1903157 RepID=UPI0035ADF94D